MNIKNRLEKLEDERKPDEVGIEGCCPHLPPRFVPYGTPDDGGQKCSKCDKPQFGVQFVPYVGDGEREQPPGD